MGGDAWQVKSGALPRSEDVERFGRPTDQGLLLGLRPTLDLLLAGDGFGLVRMRLRIDQYDGTTTLRVDCALACIVDFGPFHQVFRMTNVKGVVGA